MAPLGTQPSQQKVATRDDSRDARAPDLSRVPASNERNVLTPTGLSVQAIEVQYAGTPAAESVDLFSIGVAAGATRLLAVGLASGKPFLKIPVSATAPGAAEDGALCINSADERLYRYFETYGEWLSDQEFRIAFGKSAAVSDGENLASEYGNVSTTNSRGHIPFGDGTGDIKIVGMEGATNGSFTGSFEVYEGASATGTLIAFSSSDEESDFGLDYDFDNASAIGCRMNITSGSPTNATVVIAYRKRWV